MIEICGICRVCERGGRTARGLCFYCAQEATQALRAVHKARTLPALKKAHSEAVRLDACRRLRGTVEGGVRSS